MSKNDKGPPIPNLEQVKTIVGDRVENWTDDQLCAANAYIEVLAERDPPTPDGGHRRPCNWAYPSLHRRKGSLCTCDPERPR